MRHLFLALCAACLMAPSALASQTLRPVADKENVGKSGRAWMVRAPGSGDGSMRQLDAVSPAAVGDGKGDQGWGYLMCFGVTDAFAAQTLAADAVVTLTLKTGQALGGGSHAPVKLYLLSAKQEPGAFSQFGAYNVAPDKAAHETTIPGDAADQTLTLDLTAMLKKAGGVEPGKLVYLLLAPDPITDKNGKGQHLEVVSEGDDQPALTAGPAAADAEAAATAP